MVKRDGRRESLIGQNWQWVCEEPLPSAPDAEQINGLLSETLRRIENEFDSEVPSLVIAEAIMQRLRKVDGIAWLRYASFYEDFRDLSRFAVEIVNLGGGGKGGKDGD